MRSDMLRKLAALGVVLTPMTVLLPACEQEEGVVEEEPGGVIVEEEPGAGVIEEEPGLGEPAEEY